MPAYHFRAVYPSGRIHHGRMTAANENELSHALRESGLELIEASEHKPSRFSMFSGYPREQVSLRQRALLCRQLEDLLRAGLPFLEALQGVASTLAPGAWRGKLEAIARKVGQGSTIAAAFGQHDRLFNPVFLATLQAGETSGDLVTAFGQLAKHIERQARLRELASRALRYPLFLLCVALGVAAFMMTMVVPRVMDFLNTLGADLPFMTRVLIKLSALFAAGWWIALLVIMTCVLVFMTARRYSGPFALRSDGWLLRLPLLGPAIHKLAVARFAHSFALLLQSGAGLPESLHTAKAVLGNRALIEAAEAAERQVQAGQSLSAATSGLFPPFVSQMLRVGEQSSRLIATLDEVTRHYDTEVQSAIERLIGALEPALTLLVGALLAWVVLAVLGPVYGSLGQLNMVP
ncbi:MAG: type II secretion system F family protein [Alphaproteobacteria bacterium]|nr:type II secretion system F family protein [Alphaproteobacteria bacterium]